MILRISTYVEFRGVVNTICNFGGARYQMVFRFVYAFPTGALVYVTKRDVPTAVIVSVLLWGAMLISFEPYADVGSVQNAGWLQKSGCSDWLVGRDSKDADEVHRWMRAYSALFWTGLTWTVPPGYALYRQGYGWEFMFSGAMMPVWYSAAYYAHESPPGKTDEHWELAAGATQAEFLWGTWQWAVLLLTVLPAAEHGRWAPPVTQAVKLHEVCMH
eukprot:m.323132 g.323132  ORF g.323132 m.323132 type:complete len:216 (+) comp20358_c0_seq22:455-1102(+)